MGRAAVGIGSVAAPEGLKETALRNLERWLGEERAAPFRPAILRMIDLGRWDQLFDCFYQVIPFGTGGRRGPVGVGPNRFNPWTLASSIQGHVAFLRERFPTGELHVVIAYDVRVYEDASGAFPPGVDNPLRGITSRQFAEIAAGVYAANGVYTTLLPAGTDRFVSTPELSFAIRHLGASGGLNVSASHNPPDDSGGKFYNHLGGQEVPPDDERMAKLVEAVDRIEVMDFVDAGAFVREYGVEVHDAYVQANLAASLRQERTATVVFTGLHGTGDTTVVDVLRAAGFEVTVEPTQAPHDGRFPEVPFRAPNPEVPASMERAVALATERGADIVLATDPDADRIGLCARDGDGYRFFTGNEIGALVTEYRLTYGTYARPIVMKTEVTSELVSRVARRHGAQVVGDLLVGFKYIGDGLRRIEEGGAFAGAEGRIEDFVVGVEESHGVLVTPAMRDKDAAGAALSLAEFASVLKLRGQTLADALRQLWAREGFVVNRLVSMVMRGAAGKARIDAIGKSLRASPVRTIASLPVTELHDRADPGGSLGPIKSGTDAASRDVLVMRLGGLAEGSARVILRPSGTEPKTKVYVEVCGAPGEEAAAVEARAAEIATAFTIEALSRAGIAIPAWALAVSDLVPIEQKAHFAEALIPGVVERLGGDDPAAWIDGQLAAYGKDPRRLVAPGVVAWLAAGAPGGAGRGEEVARALGY